MTSILRLAHNVSNVSNLMVSSFSTLRSQSDDVTYSWASEVMAFFWGHFGTRNCVFCAMIVSVEFFTSIRFNLVNLFVPAVLHPVPA